jgi:hypothetical protein
MTTDDDNKKPPSPPPPAVQKLRFDAAHQNVPRPRYLATGKDRGR